MSDLTLRLRELAEDRTSGAREITGRLLNLVASTLRGRTDDLVENTLVRMASGVVPAQPTMAALLVGFDRLFRAAETGGTAAVLAETDRQLSEHQQNLSAIVAAAVARLGDARRVAILSWSSTVGEVLDRIGRKLVVLVADSRPGGEGRRAAQRSVAAGHETHFYSDSAFPVAASSADLLLLGGDALTPTALINKVGSRSAARECRARGTAVVACLEELKIVGTALAERLRILDEPASQVWEGAPAAVTVHNRYFEAVPLELISQVITSEGTSEPLGVVRKAAAVQPSRLWARVPLPVSGTAP